MNSELVTCLLDTFNSEAVRYCHWKSNFSLAQALSGELDLDLLVDRSSLPRAVGSLLHLGFKPATVRWGPDTPTVSHYYGFDPTIDRLVHVHLFSSVLTGESFVKSHLLPFDAMLLDNTERLGPMRIAAKSAELVLFICRTFIKYGSLLDLIYLFRQAAALQAELDWLLTGSDMSGALCHLKRHCPTIDEALFRRCVDALRASRSLAHRIVLAHRVRRRLGVYRRHSTLGRALAYAHLLWGQLQRRVGGRRKNKTLCAGGAVVAIVGPEATGKSTLVAECARWLGTVFAVRTVHAGKPPSSWFTAPLNFVLPLLRGLVPQFRTTRVEQPTVQADSGQPRDQRVGWLSLFYAVRLVALAWDRRQLLIRARRAAANGDIVLCDRYPSEAASAMDSRRLQEIPTRGATTTVAFNWLARLENRLYNQIPPPDLVLRLTVSVDTAMQRNRERIKPGKEQDAYVVSRHRQSQAWRMAAAKRVLYIDTERSLAETILSVKRAIWESL